MQAAAQQAFEGLKLSYLHALRGVAGAEALRRQVDQADQPLDLWLLQAPSLALLDGTDADRRSRRQLLRRGLDSLFCDLEPVGGFASP